jgi:hypothetical protein
MTLSSYQTRLCLFNKLTEVNKMPCGDGTGPRGLGAGTGGGFGPCVAGMKRGFGRGMGFGGGYGRRRFGFMPQQQTLQANEQELLQQQLKSIEQEEILLKQEKEDIQKKIEGMK